MMRTITIFIVLAAVLLGLYYIGVLPHKTHVLYYLAAAALISYTIFKKAGRQAASNFIILVMSCCLALMALDLAMRPLLKERLYYRPYEMFVRRWPPMPALSRYQKNVSYKGRTFGDLAFLSGNKDYRHVRETTFRTDAYGFRNDKDTAKKRLDVIILGDSFGDGAAVSQEDALAALFSKRYNLNAYNLSMAGSPWHELMNLKIELGRLKVHKGTLVLWFLFGGNDLDDFYGDDLKPRFNNVFKQMSIANKTFRNRSPIKQLIERVSEDRSKIEQSVIAATLPDGKIELFYKPYIERAGRSAGDILKHENYKKLSAVFDEMKKISEAKGLKVAVISISDKSEVYPWFLGGGRPPVAAAEPSGFTIAMRNLSKEHGFKFLDLKPVFVAKAKETLEESGGLLWRDDDTHWNEMGSEIVINTIYDNIIK